MTEPTPAAATPAHGRAYDRLGWQAYHELQAQVDELKESLAEGNARFDATVAAVVAQRTEAMRTQVAELRDQLALAVAELVRNERSYQAVVERADRLAAERNAQGRQLEQCRQELHAIRNSRDAWFTASQSQDQRVLVGTLETLGLTDAELRVEVGRLREVVDAARHSHEIGQVSAALCAALARLDQAQDAPPVEYHGSVCHSEHGRHYHCVNCGEISGYQGHMFGDPPVFSCAPQTHASGGTA